MLKGLSKGWHATLSWPLPYTELKSSLHSRMQLAFGAAQGVRERRSTALWAEVDYMQCSFHTLHMKELS